MTSKAPSSPIPKPDMLTHLLVLFLHLLKRVRGKFNVETMRKQAAKNENKVIKLPPGFELTHETFAGLPCDRLLTSDAKLTVLHLYGGGACVRIPSMELPAISNFCSRIKANAYLPWYSLAPEHKFPQSAEDCLAVYKALLEQGIDPEQLVLSGLSAGGGNALSLLAMLKQENLPMPACAVLLSPSGDALLVGDSWQENANRDAYFNLEDILYFSNLLLSPEQRADPLINVSLMDDFSGYPPMYFTASNNELLRDVSTMAHEKAVAAGVPSQLDIHAGGVHGQAVMLFSSQAKAIWQRVDDFVMSHVEGK